MGATGTSVVKAGIGFGTALAITISWTANKSLLWVIVHGLPGWLHRRGTRRGTTSAEP